MSTIFITGATSGFGEASAHLFAENGWNIIITGRRKERLDKLETVLKSTYKVEVLSLCFDVRDVEEVKSAISSLQDNWKNVDVLLNNAGLAAGRGPIQEGVYEDWEQMIDTNVKGLLYMTREVAPLMIARKQGHIINVASLAGWEAYGCGNVYCGTKQAVLSITRCLSRELGEFGIRVNTVSPGLTMSETVLAEDLPFLDTVRKPNVMSRAIKREEVPEDLVGTVLFLCSPDSDFVTGQSILVDGGSQNN